MPILIDNTERTLEQALKNVLSQTESIDILTAYFYFSGFSMLAEELKDKKIRILVGKSIDPNAVSDLSAAMRFDPNVPLDTYVNRRFAQLNRSQRRKEYIESFIALYNKSSLSSEFDSTDSQKMQRIFERKLKDGTLEIRLTSIPNHAKTYILTNKPEYAQNGDYKGNVFMGSSNFTYSGLTGQGELNDSFKDNSYYLQYSEHFEKLWSDSNAIDIKTKDSNDDFIKEIETRLWIHSIPDPYFVFIRILHELYAEIKSEDLYTPDTISGGKFSNLKYQLDAIREGIDSINKNNGIIIADVVGLGKSIIASSIARNLDVQSTIIITPPHLKIQWEEYVRDFGIRGALVESGGKIDKLHDRFANSNLETLFIIDEAHRYRNELTDDYQLLHQLTRSNARNKVILLTATPYNNKPQDLFALVKLFQTPSRSTITSVDNLSIRFRDLITEYRKLERQGKRKMTDDIKKKLEKLSKELRLLIEPVVIRRSRIDLKEIREYAEDLKNQNINFPTVVGPELIEYDLGEIKKAYIETLLKLTDGENGFIGARYMPSAYIKNLKEFRSAYGRFFDDTDLQTAQRNLAQFMKRLLVMRFESSKFAFSSTLDKIIRSNETILKWWDKGYVPILKKGELIDPDNLDIFDSIDEIMAQIDSGDDINIDKVKKTAIPISKDLFKNEYVTDVENDLKLLKGIYENWFSSGEIGFDPKLMRVEEKIHNLLQENPQRKIVIFTSYADTAEWVAKNLKDHGLYRTFLYTGGSSYEDKKTVSENFDASYKDQKNDYDIIVATDALSEGFNLHRAGIVINYDIPFNPTRVIQRVGRINRINKKVYDNIYIFNFFPSDVGESVTNIKGISTLKMLLINNIVGSDTKTLTPDEDLQSYFKKQYIEANSEANEASWDNEYRNIYNAIKHDTNLLRKLLYIPERTRIVRKNQELNLSISFAKRGTNTFFAMADELDEKATIVPPEMVLSYFKANQSEKAFEGDAQLDAKFEILRQRIIAPHPLPMIQGRRADALKIVEYLKESYIRERDYLEDLYEAIKTYDDLSDGELKYIAQLSLDVKRLDDAVCELKKTISENYLAVIKERAEAIDMVSEIILFTEELRK